MMLQVGSTDFALPVPEYIDSSSGGASDRAPMQGKITHVYVKPGEDVTKGQPLVAMESMKMEVKKQRYLFINILVLPNKNHPCFM